MDNKEGWTSKATKISLVTGIVGSVIASLIYDAIKNYSFLSTIISVLKFLWSILEYLLTFNIKVWWLLIFTLLTWIVWKILSTKNSTDSSNPPYYNYKTDKFKKWNWSWNWRFDSTHNAWIISNLKAHCPKCNTPMIDYSKWHVVSFGCPRCDYKARDSDCDEPHKVEQVILDNIDRDNYNK